MSGVPLPAWMSSCNSNIFSYPTDLKNVSYKYDEEKENLYKTYGGNSDNTISSNDASNAIGLLNTKGFCCYWKDMTKPQYLSWGWGSNQWVSVVDIVPGETTVNQTVANEETLSLVSPEDCKYCIRLRNGQTKSEYWFEQSAAGTHTRAGWHRINWNFISDFSKDSGKLAAFDLFEMPSCDPRYTQRNKSYKYFYLGVSENDQLLTLELNDQASVMKRRKVNALVLATSSELEENQLPLVFGIFWPLKAGSPSYTITCSGNSLCKAVRHEKAIAKQEEENKKEKEKKEKEAEQQQDMYMVFFGLLGGVILLALFAYVYRVWRRSQNPHHQHRSQNTHHPHHPPYTPYTEYTDNLSGHQTHPTGHQTRLTGHHTQPNVRHTKPTVHHTHVG